MELRQRVSDLLEIGYDRLMLNPRVCDMFVEVFKVPLCRACLKDREFAYKKLVEFLENGNTEI